MTKHTPGPWKIETVLEMIDKKSVPDIFITSEEGLWVGLAGIYVPKHKEEEAQTNACLIALAPELLEALYKIERMEIAGPGERTKGDLMALIQTMKATARLVIAKMEKTK